MSQSDVNGGATAEEFEATLRRHVLDVWFPRSVDVEHGGFLCDFDHAWRPCGPHEKLLEFQARHTWFAAEASERYPGDERLRQAALHGFRYLRDVMWDSDAGGWFHRLDRAGRPLHAHTKHVHGAAYAIVACVAVHEALGEPGALDLAREAFAWLEHTAHDDRHGGYFGFLKRDNSRILEPAACPWSSAFDTIGTPIGLKDTNVHSDLLETFARLYHAWPDPKVAQRLAEVISVLGEKVIAASGAMHFFFEPDWTPVPHVTRTGYQVQTAYRLLAARGLGGDAQSMATIARRLVDHALRHAWDGRRGGFFDVGPGANPTPIGDRDLETRRKSWWIQTEGLKALLSLREVDGGDPRYPRYFGALWSYMRRHMIDARHGGVFTVGLETVPWWRRRLGVGFAPASFVRKGSDWKDCSHDGRAWLHCLAILRAHELERRTSEA